MTCESAREQIQNAVDGRLAPAETEALVLHLHGCASCRAYSSAMAELDRALSDEASRDAQITAPPELMARLGLEDGAPVLVPVRVQPSVWRRWLPAGIAAAGLVVAIGIGYFQKPAPEVASVEAPLSDAEAIHLWIDPEAELVSWTGE